jgi:hypothetical protein
MASLDLNIDNYNLEDLLVLFGLDHSFDSQDIKRCKKLVLMTHPDKSHMSEEYYIFFTKAYNLLCDIHGYRNNKTSSVTYNPKEVHESTPSASINALQDFMKNDDFNDRFNKLFDQHNISSVQETTGYSDFLSSDIDANIQRLYDTSLSKVEKDVLLETIRQDQLSVYKDVQESGLCNTLSTIDGEIPSTFESDLFSSLQYGDIQSVHDNSLISVNDDDIRKDTYTTIDGLMQHRSVIDTPMSKEESLEYFNTQDKSKSKDNIQRAYRLAKQYEQSQSVNGSIRSYFNTITN